MELTNAANGNWRTGRLLSLVRTATCSLHGQATGSRPKYAFTLERKIEVSSTAAERGSVGEAHHYRRAR